jgi:anti-sigma regulatory factor (Ser/Thr protein kinase)
MSTSLLVGTSKSIDPFRHEAFFYDGESQFLEGTTAFIGDAVTAGEPILVVLSSRKIDLLRDRLQSAARAVRFADMDEVGLNPARIIPAWSEFVDEIGERSMRGIGEPIWAERTAAELVECQLHESLLNLAFAGCSGFTLLCPYDTVALGPDVLHEACHSHPYLREGGTSSTSPKYQGLDRLDSPFSAPLPEAPSASIDLVLQPGSLHDLRDDVARQAAYAGMSAGRAADAATAVNEVASNSLRHAGGRGVLRMWQTGDAFICEVSDDGYIHEPLVGRIRPDVEGLSGRGLWIVNQLCDLVQVRSTTAGTTVRMHFRRHSGASGPAPGDL